MKTCSKCNKEKAESEFYKCAANHDGLQSRCKTCAGAEGRVYRAKNRDSLLEKRAEYNFEHHEERAAKRAEYYIEHREEIRARSRVANLTPQQQEKQRARGREKARTRLILHPEECRAARRRYYKTSARARAAAYAANLNREAAGPKITPEIIAELHAEYGNMCPYCQEMIVKGHIDHIRPISKGGTNVRENLVYCCESCNTQKQDKSLLQFLLYRCELAKEEACSDAS